MTEKLYRIKRLVWNLYNEAYAGFNIHYQANETGTFSVTTVGEYEEDVQDIECANGIEYAKRAAEAHYRDRLLQYLEEV